MAYIKKIWKDYPDTTTPIKAEDLNNIENGIENLENGIENLENGIEAVDTVVNNGWIPLTGTFAYSSADSPTFVMSTSVDLTGIVGLGMRIKLTQETTKYFIVTAITTSSITMYGGTDYTLTSGAISNSYYSMLKAPFGFPLNHDKWTITYTDSTNRLTNSPAQRTWYNATSFSIPIGLWEMDFGICVYATRTSAGVVNLRITISSANNSESDATKTLNMQGSSVLTLGDQSLFARFVYGTSSKITRYINYSTAESGMSVIGITNMRQNMVISLKCAYL